MSLGFCMSWLVVFSTDVNSILINAKHISETPDLSSSWIFAFKLESIWTGAVAVWGGSFELAWKLSFPAGYSTKAWEQGCASS